MPQSCERRLRSIARKQRYALTRTAHPDLSWTGAIGWHHHPIALHLLDHPRGPVVADSQPPLDHRDRRLPGLDHDSHCLVVEVVALIHGASLAVVLARHLGFEDLHLI